MLATEDFGGEVVGVARALGHETEGGGEGGREGGRDMRHCPRIGHENDAREQGREGRREGGKEGRKEKGMEGDEAAGGDV